jgi:hypothetical protein
MPQEVHFGAPEHADDFLASLQELGTNARKVGRRVVVDDVDGGSPGETMLELLFFLRAWALLHPGSGFELVEQDAGC